MAKETILSLKEYKEEIEKIQKSVGDLENGTAKYNGLLNQTVGTLSENNKMLNQQKEALKDLKNQYKDGTISLDVFTKRERELKTSIQELNRQVNTQQKLANDTKGSYNDLSHTLELLKQSYKQLDEQQKASQGGKEMLKDIQTLDEYLKKSAASMGEYQRNVGNYAGAFKEVSGLFQQLGVNINGLSPAFNVATVAAQGFNGALNALKSHPFIAVLGVLVATFMKLKDAISKNEESSKKWSVAMSAFKPILNAITNAIDWLATGLVNVVSYVSESLPTILRNFGGFAKGVTKVAGTILDVMLFVPRKIVEAYSWMNSKVIDGIKWVIDGVADLLDFFGFDVAKGMKQWTKSISDTAKSAMNKVNEVMAGAGEYVAKFGDDIDATMEKWAKATEHQMELTKRQQKLDEDRRESEKLTEESLLKQQDLRNKIAEASGEEKKRLLNQLKQEIETNGKRELDIARRTLELEKEKRKLAPNSREDNLYFEELEKNVIRVEAATKGATVRINKQITSTTDKISSDAEKAAEKAIREAEKASAEILKNAKVSLEGVRTGTEQALAELEAEYKEQQELGKLGLKEQQEYEDMRHKIIEDGYNEQRRLIAETLKDAKLQDDEKLALEILSQKALIGLVNEETKHRINNNKIWLEDRKKTLQEVFDEENNSNRKNVNKIEVDYVENFVSETNKYLEGELSFEQYQKNLSKIQQDAEKERLDEQVRYSEIAMQQYDNYRKEVLDKFGAGSDEYKAALDKYNDAVQKNQDAINAQTMFVAKAQVKQKEDTKKFTEQQVKTYQSMAKGISSIFGTVSDILEENIKQKQKNGEISEKEAEEEFERVKALQISEAVVNTISGAVGAFMQDKKAYPAPYNYIIAGIDIASTLAAGIAQIQKIKSATFGSDSASGSSGSVDTGVSVVPLLNEQADVNTLQNIQTENSMLQLQEQRDQRVYILQQDLVDSDKQVQVREKNTSF